jgi:YggT family protein
VAILGRILMSWIAPNGGGAVSRILYDVTEPVLGPFRRIIPQIGMIDISPMVAILVLQLAHQAIDSILRSFLF